MAHQAADVLPAVPQLLTSVRAAKTARGGRPGGGVAWQHRPTSPRALRRPAVARLGHHHGAHRTGTFVAGGSAAMLSAVQQLSACLPALVPVHTAGTADGFGVFPAPARLLSCARAGRAGAGVAKQCAAVRAAGIGLSSLTGLAAAAGHEHRIHRWLCHFTAVALVHRQARLWVERLAKWAAEAIQLVLCRDAGC